MTETRFIFLLIQIINAHNASLPAVASLKVLRTAVLAIVYDQVSNACFPSESILRIATVILPEYFGKLTFDKLRVRKLARVIYFSEVKNKVWLVAHNIFLYTDIIHQPRKR